ncbi:MAG: HEAT repeat domain-containing protein [Gemmatimonadota bacterium]
MAPGSNSPDLNLGKGEPDEGAPAPAINFNLDLTLPDQSFDSVAPKLETKGMPLRSGIPDANPDELDSSDVANFFTALDKAVRARRLYQANNPVFQGFVQTLRDALFRLWGVTNSLSVMVEEHGFKWNDVSFTVGEGRDNMAFLFFKDGIRYLTFLPTFEDEIDAFLDVMQKTRVLDQHSDDDMVTILWEKEFTAFQYSYVDALAEGLHVPDSVPVRSVDRVEPAKIQADAQSEVASDADQAPAAIQQGKPSVASSITREDFEETLYFLEPSELAVIRDEVEKEWQRDLKADVLAAMFDRLEDPIPARQTEILRILRQLLPAYLGRGDLASASTILIELNGVVEAADILGPDQAQLARELFSELSEPAALTQLLRSLEEGAIDPSGVELGIFLRHLGSQALPLLLRATETTRVVALQGRLRIAVAQLGRAHPDRLIELIKSEDEIIAAGATNLAGQMALPSSAPAVATLLTRPSIPLRRAAVDALILIKSGAALEALQTALDDGDRDTRIAAARGLATLRYQPARHRLQAIIDGHRLRDADLTEKIAFFEAFGAVANAESVTMLDRMLNGKNLLRQKQPPELRACAAMALGRVGSPASRAALERASDEQHPMVRNAVLKATRQEMSAP